MLEEHGPAPPVRRPDGDDPAGRGHAGESGAGHQAAPRGRARGADARRPPRPGSRSLGSSSPTWCCMDLGLPDMNGWEALDRRSAPTDRAAACGSIAFTAHAMVGDRERALAAGFDGYLSKPIDFATFVDSVAGLPGLRRDRAADPGRRRRARQPRAAAQAPDASGLRRRRGGRRAIRAAAASASSARPRLPRRDDARARRHRGLPAAAPSAGARRPADPAAHRARPTRGQGPRSRGRRKRLPDEAVRPERAVGPTALAAADEGAPGPARRPAWTVRQRERRGRGAP